jgi:hypothetical protein
LMSLAWQLKQHLLIWCLLSWFCEWQQQLLKLSLRSDVLFSFLWSLWLICSLFLVPLMTLHLPNCS